MVEYKLVMEELMHKLEKYYHDLFKDVMNKLEGIAYDISLDKV